MGKDIPTKHNRLSENLLEETIIWCLHNDKKVNSPRRYNNYKHICNKHKTSKYMKQTLAKLKREIALQ